MIIIKKFIKSNKKLYGFLLSSRDIFRILYNTKRRSRFFWKLRKGDERLSLQYPLDSDSVVFDVGAFTGGFTQQIFLKFNCYVYAFEPLKNYSDILKNKFKNNHKIKILDFGLFDKNKKILISNIGASSSIFSRVEGEASELVEFRSFFEFVNDNSIKKINLLYMNIEGSEYNLMKHIIKTDYIKNIDHLQIQFHNYVEGSKQLRKQIRDELKKTHTCIFNFPFIWERWDRI
jgi:FkbM family methyltransferase